MATFRFSHAADSDLDDIWQYISADNGEMADRFIARLLKTVELLAENPMLGAARPAFKNGLRSFRFTNYMIFYFPTDFGVEIFRVLHGRRDITDELSVNE